MRERVCYPPDSQPYDVPPTETRIESKPWWSKIFTVAVLAVVGSAIGWMLLYFAVSFVIALIWYL